MCRVLRAGHEAERAAHGVEHDLAGAAFGVVDETVERQLGFRSDIEDGLVHKQKLRGAGFAGADALVGEYVAADRQRPRIRARDALDLILDGGGHPDLGLGGVGVVSGAGEKAGCSKKAGVNPHGARP